MNENEYAQETKTSIDSEQESSNPSLFKKVLFINVIIFGFVLMGIVLVIRHLNPAQVVNTLTTDLHKLEKRLALTEEKIRLYESYFLTLNNQLEHLAANKNEPAKNESTQQKTDTSYQDLIIEFKTLMDTETSSPLSIPLLEEGRFFKWLTRHIQIKETPHHQIYKKAYELLKEGNLLQAIELLHPLGHNPASSLHHWLAKAINFQKSLSRGDES